MSEELRDKLLGRGVQAGPWERTKESTMRDSDNQAELERTPDPGASSDTGYTPQVLPGLLWERTGTKGLDPIIWFGRNDLCSAREIPFWISREFCLVSPPQLPFAKLKHELYFKSNPRACAQP